jgi:hypothetical protein
VSSVMPLVKINTNLRINLFNITQVSLQQLNSTVTIRFVDGTSAELRDQEGERFLTYFDTFCDDMQSVQQIHTHTAPETAGRS